MCMLFIKPSDFALPETYFKSLWAKNSDGLSAYNMQSRELYKTLVKTEAWQYIQDNAENELILHFRFGTSGNNTLDQLHGFNVGNDEYYLFHNGVLSSYKGCKDFSDTQYLASYFKDKSLSDMISFLEQNEKGSRFILLEKSTNNIYKPNCAKWNEPTVFNCGTEISFSNTYAIDWHLLGFGNQWSSFDLNTSYKSVAGFYDDEEFDNDFYELDYYIQQGDKQSIKDFVYNHPDIVADYLLYMGA